MQGHFHQFRVVDLDEGTGPGEHRQNQFGCDGVHHVIAKAVAELDAAGKVVSGATDGFDQLGLCDDSCGATIRDHGGLGFQYEYDPTKDY